MFGVVWKTGRLASRTFIHDRHFFKAQVVAVVIAFFRAISHQYYGTPEFHTVVRQAGIKNLKAHPDSLIESIDTDSWKTYLQRIAAVPFITFPFLKIVTAIKVVSTVF